MHDQNDPYTLDSNPKHRTAEIPDTFAREEAKQERDRKELRQLAMISGEVPGLGLTTVLIETFPDVEPPSVSAQALALRLLASGGMVDLSDPHAVDMCWKLGVHELAHAFEAEPRGSLIDMATVGHVGPFSEVCAAWGPIAFIDLDDRRAVGITRVLNGGMQDVFRFQQRNGVNYCQFIGSVDA